MHPSVSSNESWGLIHIEHDIQSINKLDEELINRLSRLFVTREPYQTYLTFYAHKLSFSHLMQITRDKLRYVLYFHVQITRDNQVLCVLPRANNIHIQVL